MDKKTNLQLVVNDGPPKMPFPAATTSVPKALRYLEGFVQAFWCRGSTKCAYDAKGKEVAPESDDAQTFTLSGSCRRLFYFSVSGQIACLLSEVNDVVFGVPVTHVWEETASLSDVLRLIRTAEFIAQHQIMQDLSFEDIDQVQEAHEIGQRYKAIRRAQAWQKVNGFLGRGSQQVAA